MACTMIRTAETVHTERHVMLLQVLLGLSKEALSMSQKKPWPSQSAGRTTKEATKEAAVAKEQAAAQEVSCSNNSLQMLVTKL